MQLLFFFYDFFQAFVSQLRKLRFQFFTVMIFSSFSNYQASSSEIIILLY